MEINAAAMVGFKTKFDSIFNAAFELAGSLYDKVAYVYDSGRVELVNHRWMRGFPGMREFIGARKINNFGSDGFIVRNKKWEQTIGIKREDLERDQWGVYTPHLQRFGESAKQHRDELVFGVLSGSLASPSTYPAYDGIAFFGNHNAQRTVAFNNLAPNGFRALNKTNLQIAITSLRKRTDTAGKKLAAARGRPLLVVSPDLEFVASELANLSFFPGTSPGSGNSSSTNQAASSENILKGMFDVEVSPWLTTGTEWFVMLKDNIFRPVIFQMERELEILAWDKFLHRYAEFDEYTWGCSALYNAAVGLPEMVYGSTGVDT